MRKTILTLCVLMMTGAAAMAQPKTVAHRGYWDKEGAAMNSIAALHNAHAAGCYGSEFDVHATKDGVLVVNHDDDIEGIVIEEAEYSQLKSLKLANGERVPTLKQYLKAARRLDGMRLVLEIKSHKSHAREDFCVAEAVKAVKKAGLDSRTDYISFSLHACEQVLKECPTARVYYLNGDLTPLQVKDKGFAGIDYHGNVFRQHPNWIAQAHELGLEVNVWTINNTADLTHFTAAGVDYITTNNPIESMRIAAGATSK